MHSCVGSLHSSQAPPAQAEDAVSRAVDTVDNTAVSIFVDIVDHWLN